MKLIPLPNETVEQTGYTHKVTFDYTDLQTAATTISKTFLPEPGATFPAGIEISKIGLRVITVFGGGAISALTVNVGDSGSATRFLSATSLLTAGTTYGGGTPRMYTAADSTIGAFTATGANLSALTAGKAEIYITVVDLARLATVV